MKSNLKQICSNVMGILGFVIILFIFFYIPNMKEREFEKKVQLIGDIDLFNYKTDFSALKTVLQENVQPFNDGENNSSAIFGKGMVVVNLYTPNMEIVKIQINEPFKGSILGVHPGNKSDYWRSWFKTNGWEPNISNNRNAVFTQSNWTIYWLEDDAKSIFTVTLLNNKYYFYARK